MKKLLTFIISSLFLTSFVSAEETITIDLTSYYRDFDKAITDIYSNDSEYQDLMALYNTTYATNYPHFLIRTSGSYYGSSEVHYNMTLFPTSYDLSNLTACLDPTYPTDDIHLCNNGTYYDWNNSGVINLSYNSINDTYTSSTLSNARVLYYSSTSSAYNAPVYSNFDISLSIDHTYSIPPFTSSLHDISFQYFELTEGNNLPTYLSLYEGDYLPGVSYTSINLNNYDYVALSLRDYTQTQAFSTNFIVEGQLCITPVYDYGMTEKTGAGYKVQRCSPVYSTPSPMRVYIIENDLKNHAIYYLKAYNTSISNIIKVDSSIFNITYIDSSTSQPYINVNGVQYPSIPYSQLTSSATLSESEGYVSGEVTNVFDTSSDPDFIENLFSNPLETLKTTWATILTMFSLIGSFINLLPNVLQAFLYTALALALTIGIIKLL